MKLNIPPIQSETMVLRLIQKNDLVSTLAWRNQDDVRKWFKTADEISLEQHIKWFESYQQKNDDYLFVLEVNSAPIGQVSVYKIDQVIKQAEVGRFLMSPSFSGQGYMKKACLLLIELCRDFFDLNSIYLEVFDNNIRAIQLYEALNFVKESHCDGLIKMRLCLKRTMQ